MRSRLFTKLPAAGQARVAVGTHGGLATGMSLSAINTIAAVNDEDVRA